MQTTQFWVFFLPRHCGEQNPGTRYQAAPEMRNTAEALRQKSGVERLEAKVEPLLTYARVGFECRKKGVRRPPCSPHPRSSLRGTFALRRSALDFSLGRQCAKDSLRPCSGDSNHRTTPVVGADTLQEYFAYKELPLPIGSP